MLAGKKLTFDEESKALYDAVAPTNDPAVFERTVEELGKRLPGTGSVLERYDAFRSHFVIPRDRLDATFKAAIDGCRNRTLQHVTLPPGESFTVECVTNKSWSGYNWYQGQFKSVIQVNTDLPIYVDRAIDLACHEGYPGHHVYNMLLEKNLLRDRGWVEFSVTRCSRRSRSSRKGRPSVSTSRSPPRLRLRRGRLQPGSSGRARHDLPGGWD